MPAMDCPNHPFCNKTRPPEWFSPEAGLFYAGSLRKSLLLIRQSHYLTPIRILARSELPSRIMVFSVPFRLARRASRAIMNS